MKVIDILNKRANNEEIPLKIKHTGDIYVMNNNNFTESIERLYVWEEDNDISWLDREYFTLNTEVEVIEDNEDDEDEIKKLRKEMEELKKEFDILKTDAYVHINDILSHNGSPITLKTGIENENHTVFIYDDKGLKIRED